MPASDNDMDTDYWHGNVNWLPVNRSIPQCSFISAAAECDVNYDYNTLN